MRQSVIDRCALLNKPLPGAVQAQDDLLMFFLDRDKAHVRTRDGFADRRSICRVIFSAFTAHAIRHDELGSHQFHRVAMLAKQSRPVVRSRAGLHSDHTRWKLHHQRQQLLPRNLRLDQYRLAVIINTVHGKDVLGEIDSNGDNAHGLPLSWF